MTTQLTTLAAARQYLKIAAATVSATEDAEITRLITAVSELAVTVMNRDIGSQAYTESYDGSGNVRQPLKNFPVTAVASVYCDGVLQTAAGSSITAAGYRFDRYSVFFNGGMVFPIGIQNIQVTYTAGLAAVPPDLAQAALQTVAYLYRERDHFGQSSVAIGQGGGQTSYTVTDIPKNAKLVFESYRSRSPM